MDTPARHFTTDNAGTTVLHPLSLALLLTCGVALLLLPRRYAMWPVIVLACFVSGRQCIAIAGFNLYFMRFIALTFGLLRVTLRNEFRGLKLNTLDLLVLAYVAGYLLSGALLWNFYLPELKTRSGYVFETTALYFLARTLVRDSSDIKSTVFCFALIAMPTCGFFIFENLTARNVFAIFGGVPETTAIRGNRLRCQGPYGHPILAGVFWASLTPLLIYYTWERRAFRRLLAGASVLCAAGIVLLSASSTPVLGLLAAIVGMSCFRLRKLTRPLALLTFAALIALHFAMESPVWSLIHRINVTEGNSGYHRYLLVDRFIKNYHEWWLLGSRLGTAHWGHFTHDTANQYVSVGVTCGFITLAVFIALIIQTFRNAGRIAKHSPLLGWALGVTAFVHSLCFFGISIWGQLHFAWALLLALSNTSLRAPHAAPRPQLATPPLFQERTTCTAHVTRLANGA